MRRTLTAVLVDRRLIARLDRSAARYELAVADAYRRHGDDVARSAPFGDGALVAHGPGGYVNRALGVSLADPGDDGFEEIESFFGAAGVEPAIELSSWAAPTVLLRLGERRYQPHWFGEMFVRPLSASGTTASVRDGVTVRNVDAGSAREWQRIYTAAFGYDTPDSLAVARRHTAAVLDVPGATHWLADLDGRPAGCASAYVDDEGVAWLGGAATMPVYRGHGVQAALLDHRVEHARLAGAELVAVTAVPDSGSARNVRRAGFTSAHTRLIMRRRTDRD
jgi:GNAT superfamily N-acetyltransferase